MHLFINLISSLPFYLIFRKGFIGRTVLSYQNYVRHLTTVWRQKAKLNFFPTVV